MPRLEWPPGGAKAAKSKKGQMAAKPGSLRLAGKGKPLLEKAEWGMSFAHLGGNSMAGFEGKRTAPNLSTHAQTFSSLMFHKQCGFGNRQ